jgi:hypothetical protein
MNQREGAVRKACQRPRLKSSDVTAASAVSLAACIVLLLVPAVLADKTLEQVREDEHRELTEQINRARTSPSAWRDRLLRESLDRASLILPADRDPLEVVLRRTAALLEYARTLSWFAADRCQELATELTQLQRAADSTSDPQVRRTLFDRTCALRRDIALANPLLNFDAIVCMLEQPGTERIVEQARAVWRGHSAGGGPVVIRSIRSQPQCVSLLADVPVADGPWRGQLLTGKFSGLELDFDARQILFAATTDTDIWRIFRFDLVTRELSQLTDGTHDDFDPCLLPSGRIVFTSTRRVGVGRCVLTPQSLTYTLCSMAPDGSDVVPLSFHETNEWQPSVNHAGKIVYTRWDYVDRHWGTAHHFWECLPDGRDPRSYHGNYPLPWSAMPANAQPEDYGRPELVNGRVLRPDVEMGYRAVPGSGKYVATAVGHHEGFSGSLVLVNPRVPDDGMMAQVKRITPEYPFPEVEPAGLYAYGTPWPLSDDFYLCSYYTGLYLLDRFGNREVLYDPGSAAYRLRDPFPLRPRDTPPALAVMTWQGKRESRPDHHRAVLSVANVYDSDDVGRLPPGTKVRWLRIVQVIPQLFDQEFSINTVTQVSFASDSPGRMALGVVPVEEDGSVYCEAPVGKAIYFQLLDDEGLAIQSMRSATYVHPGERLYCQGCHEDKWKAPRPSSTPLALQRPPSRLEPEVVGGALPFNFIELVKRPVFDEKCVACHAQHPAAPDMSYGSLARYDRAFSYPGEPGLTLIGVGGSRTAPGHFGARASGILKSLRTKDYHKDVMLSQDQWRRLILWLDLNSNEIGWIGNDRSQIAAQKKGVALWPPIDMDPLNPTGIEVSFPEQTCGN